MYLVVLCLIYFHAVRKQHIYTRTHMLVSYTKAHRYKLLAKYLHTQNPRNSYSHDALKPKGSLAKRSQERLRKFTIVDPSVVDLRKDESYTHEPSRDLFKVYFDELPTGKQGDRMLSYLRDGKFIDIKCETVCI
jgi:hypothetical protein